MAEETKKDKKKTYGGMLIPAGLFIGMGIGWLMDYLVAGLFIGLGAGFVGFALIMVLVKD